MMLMKDSQEGKPERVHLATVQRIAVVLAVTFGIGMQLARECLLHVYKH